jgi:hypothetical protein
MAKASIPGSSKFGPNSIEQKGAAAAAKGASKASNAQGNAEPTACLIGMPSISLGPVSGGGFCILSKTEARAGMGLLILAAGGVVLIIGTLVIASYGLKASGAASAAGKTAEVAGGAVAVVPGLEAPGAAVAAGGHRVARTSGPGIAQRASQRRTAASKRRAVRREKQPRAIEA